MVYDEGGKVVIAWERADQEGPLDGVVNVQE